MVFCQLCKLHFRDNFNYNRHRATKKCKKKQESPLPFENTKLTFLEKDILNGERGVATRVYYSLELKTKYILKDASRKKFELCELRTVDINCHKLITFCQPIVNKSIEYYFGGGRGDWLELAPALKQNVLSTKELGSEFVKHIIELAT